MSRNDKEDNQPWLRLIAVDGVLRRGAYKSGRTRRRATPVTSSNFTTRSDGTLVESHSQTVGCVTPIDSAMNSCVIPRLLSSDLMSTMPQIIGPSYSSAIGSSYERPGQNCGMSKKRSILDRAKEVLGEKGLPQTQTYIAELLGIKQPSVSQWDDPGRYGGDPKNIRRLAKILGVCFDWLQDEVGPKYLGPPQNDALAGRFWSMWETMPLAVRENIVGYATVQQEIHKRIVVHETEDPVQSDGATERKRNVRR